MRMEILQSLKKEQDRKDKVDKHGSEKVPAGGGAPDEKKINSVKELDDLFSNMDL